MAKIYSNPLKPPTLDLSVSPKVPTSNTKPAVQPTKPVLPALSDPAGLRDIFARLLSFSIGPAMAGNGLPPGVPTGPGSGVLAVPRFAFNPMRIA